jgi:hypothetical protein
MGELLCGRIHLVETRNTPKFSNIAIGTLIFIKFVPAPIRGLGFEAVKAENLKCPLKGLIPEPDKFAAHLAGLPQE